SYALLTHLVAHVTALGVGGSIHTFGDVHIYTNHLEQADEQLRPQPYPLPRLRIDRSVNSLDTVERTQIDLLDYQCHPTIKAEAWATDHQVDEIMVAGGAEVYRKAVPLCDRIDLTVVEGQFQGDTYFPNVSLGPPDWRTVHQEAWPADEKNPHPHRFSILERV